MTCPECRSVLWRDEEADLFCLVCRYRYVLARPAALVPVGWKKRDGTFVRERRNR